MQISLIRNFMTLSSWQDDHVIKLTKLSQTTESSTLLLTCFDGISINKQYIPT
jgi:hypothetical protein